MNLTIISPAKNEADNLPELIKRISAVANKYHYRHEIIIVDDHSTDQTKKIIRRLQKNNPDLKIINSNGVGPGAAILTGVKHARFPVIITLDSDLSHDPEIIPAFVEKFIKTKSDLIIGSRFIKGGQANLPAFRLLLSKLAASLVSLLTGHQLGDATSGFRIQTKKLLENLKLQNQGFALHLEIPLKAILGHYKITEVPIHYQKRKFGSSKMRPFKIGPSYLKVLFIELIKHNFAFLYQTSN